MKVYGLCDPNSDELKYVGCTNGRLNVRLNNHIAKRGHTRGSISRWLSDLKDNGQRPEVFLIEETDDPMAEGFYIQYFSMIGADLFNQQTPLAHGFRYHDEARKRISATMTGMAKTPEHIEHAAAAQRGVPRKPMSPESRAKHSAAMKGRSLPPEHRKHLSEAAFRRYHH